jgi:hypothetical protein
MMITQPLQQKPISLRHSHLQRLIEPLITHRNTPNRHRITHDIHDSKQRLYGGICRRYVYPSVLHCRYNVVYCIVLQKSSPLVNYE